MANEQNLRKLTTTQAREIGKLGGMKSALAKKRKRTLREIAEMVGTMPITDPKMLAKLREAGFEDPITNDDAAFFGLIRKAQSGDPSAMKLLAEMRGQYSTRVEVEPVQPKPLIDLTGGKK